MKTYKITYFSRLTNTFSDAIFRTGKDIFDLVNNSLVETENEYIYKIEEFNINNITE